MSQCRISGWRPGANTIELIKTISAELKIPLNEALLIVNKVLGGEIVVLKLPTELHADKFVEALNKLGAMADILNGD